MCMIGESSPGVWDRVTEPCTGRPRAVCSMYSKGIIEQGVARMHSMPDDR